MQTTAKTRRFIPIQVRHAAIVLALAAGIAGVALAAAESSDDGSTTSEPARVVRPVGTEHPMFDYQFMEQNVYLPVAPESAVPKSTAPDWLFLEQNSWGEDFVFDTTAGGSYYPSVDDVPQLEPGQVTY
jgi:hypothetical protein